MSRLIQDTIRSALADELLFGRLANGGKVTVDVKDGKVVLEFEEEAVPHNCSTLPNQAGSAWLLPGPSRCQMRAPSTLPRALDPAGQLPTWRFPRHCRRQLLRCTPSAKANGWCPHGGSRYAPLRARRVADVILCTLEHFGLHWDEAVLYQSQRSAAYREALQQLQASNVARLHAARICRLRPAAASRVRSILAPVAMDYRRLHRAWRVRTDQTPSLLSPSQIRVRRCTARTSHSGSGSRDWPFLSYCAPMDCLPTSWRW